MSFAHLIKEIGRGAQGARDLSYDDARQLYGALLDGGISDLQLGAVLIALRMKGESLDEMSGFLAAVQERLPVLPAPRARPRPVIVPSCNGARKSANLTPLLVLLLLRYGVPVLLHGPLEGYGRITSAQILRELGSAPCSQWTQVPGVLDGERAVFVPVSLLSPGLSRLLALRGALGVRNSAHSLVKMIDPFRGQGVLLATGTHPAYLDLMREVLCRQPGRAILFRASEGEPFANPRRRPRIEWIRDGHCEVLFDAEHESLRSLPDLPGGADAASTAAWIRRVLDGQVPLPLPIAHQLACCLYASGRVDDFNAAKAMVAVEGCALPAS